LAGEFGQSTLLLMLVVVLLILLLPSPRDQEAEKGWADEQADADVDQRAHGAVEVDQGGGVMQLPLKTAKKRLF
jgi:hypothetical protein